MALSKSVWLVAFRDFILLLAISITAISLSTAIFEENYNPLMWVWGGLYFSLYPAYLFLPIPLVVVLYLTFTVFVRVFRSKYAFFIASWFLVIFSNFYEIYRVHTNNLSTGTVRIRGYDLYQDGQITLFGMIVHNVSAEVIMALLATLIIFSPRVYKIFFKDNSSQQN